MEKFVFMESILKMAGGVCTPTSSLDPSLPAPITTSLTATPNSWFGFSMMWSKFCHRCFEITAHTALAQFGHFTSKQGFGLKKKRGDPPPPPPRVRHCNMVNLDASLGNALI